MATMRYTLLFMLSLLAVACVAPTQQAVSGSQQDHVSGPAPTVGVYYYPWFGYSDRGLDFGDTLRAHLDPPHKPELDDYDSRDPDVIARHIDYSRRGNIHFWAMSWWGPDSHTEVTLREHFLTHPRVREINFCIHYESPGRLGPFDKPDFTNLVDDFRYLAKTYFTQPNYLRIQGRPVVIIYLTRAYFLTEDARRAARELRQVMRGELGIELYLVGDDFFVDGLDPQRAVLWDAVTSFDLYGMSFQQHGGTPKGINVLADLHRDAHDSAKALGVGFIPTVSPGYNDTAVRGGHVPRGRYITENGRALEHGSLFRASLSRTALPFLDPSAGGILMVNSFNEWYEDTQIEPTAPGVTTDQDDSGRQIYTQGVRYEAYGYKYLDILAQMTRIDVSNER